MISFRVFFVAAEMLVTVRRVLVGWPGLEALQFWIGKCSTSDCAVINYEIGCFL